MPVTPLHERGVVGMTTRPTLRKITGRTATIPTYDVTVAGQFVGRVYRTARLSDGYRWLSTARDSQPTRTRADAVAQLVDTNNR